METTTERLNGIQRLQLPSKKASKIWHVWLSSLRKEKKTSIDYFYRAKLGTISHQNIAKWISPGVQLHKNVIISTAMIRFIDLQVTETENGWGVNEKNAKAIKVAPTIL